MSNDLGIFSNAAIMRELGRRYKLKELTTEELQEEIKKRIDRAELMGSGFVLLEKLGTEKKAFVDYAAAYFKVHPTVLMSRDRAEPLASWRAVTYAVARRVLGLTLEACGDLFGRTHGSILHAERVKVAQSPGLVETANDLEARWRAEKSRSAEEK